MIRKTLLGSLLMSASVAVGAVACGGGSSTGSGGSGGGVGNTGGAGGGTVRDHSVVLYSWWTNPGEAEALQGIVDTYKGKYPGASVNNLALAVHGASETLLDETIETSPPDIFQWNGYKLGELVQKHPTAIASSDFVFEDAGLKGAVIQGVVDAIKIDGHAYGVPTGIHRENSFFYNKALFTQYSIPRPTSFSDVLAACAKLKTANVTCISAAGQSWISDKMWVVVLQSVMKADLFKAFITGAKGFDDVDVAAGLSEAADTFKTVTQDYVDRAHLADSSFGWPNAADDLHQGKTAVYMHGDWVKGYLVQLGWLPGIDFEQSGPPGATDVFYYGVDVLGIAAKGAHTENAKDFLAVVASKEGQAAFNKMKGSTPMRTDTRSQLDPLGQRNLDDLTTAKVSMPVVNTGWGDIVHAFAQDGDKAKFLAGIKEKGIPK